MGAKKNEDEKKEQDRTDKINKTHELKLMERKELILSGVEEVFNFNENSVAILTTQGGMEVKGKDLNIKSLNLDSGEMIIRGMIDVLSYELLERKKGIWKRLFR